MVLTTINFNKKLMDCSFITNINLIIVEFLLNILAIFAKTNFCISQQWWLFCYSTNSLKSTIKTTDNWFELFLKNKSLNVNFSNYNNNILVIQNMYTYKFSTFDFRMRVPRLSQCK